MTNEQGSPVTIKVETVAISDLKKHPRNYRHHPERQLEHIASMLSQVGLYRNVVIAEDGTILAGHGVVQAASEKLGWTRIDVRRLSLPPDSPLALKVLTADNELGRFAEDSDRQLTELLKEVMDQDPLALLGTGYDDTMLAALVMTTRPASEIDHMNEAAEYLGLPEYEDGGRPIRLVITFPTVEDRERFVRAKQVVIDKSAIKNQTWSTRWPWTDREDTAGIRFQTKKEPSTAPSSVAPDAPPESASAPRRRVRKAEAAS